MAMTEEAPARGAGRVAAALRSGPLSVPGFRLLTFGQRRQNANRAPRLTRGSLAGPDRPGSPRPS